MLFLALGGVVLGFVLLLVSLVTDNAAWAWACIAVCVAAGGLLVFEVLRGRRRSDGADPQPPSGSDPAASDPAASAQAASDQALPEQVAPAGEPLPEEHRADPDGDDATVVVPAAVAAGTASDGPDAGTTDDRNRDDGTRDDGMQDDRTQDRGRGEPPADAPTQVLAPVLDDRAVEGGAGESRGRHGRPEADEPGGTVEDAVEVADPDADRATEPGEEDPGRVEADLAADSDAEVLVVDERPRFHVVTCTWLGGRQTIPLPAREAVDLGFTPCAVCRPVAALATRG